MGKKKGSAKGNPTTTASSGYTSHFVLAAAGLAAALVASRVLNNWGPEYDSTLVRVPKPPQQPTTSEMAYDPTLPVDQVLERIKTLQDKYPSTLLNEVNRPSSSSSLTLTAPAGSTHLFVQRFPHRR